MSLPRSAAVLLVLFIGSIASYAGESPVVWSAKDAGAYLDGRITWWANWPTAARDHQTFCVSCHTALPYALGRPALRSALSEQGPSAPEQALLDNVTKRVRMWKEVEPFYPDAVRGVPKTIESRGTESVLNALILTRYDAPEAKLALDNMWAEQLTSGDAKGAWNWLQFHNAPWEGDSQYYGATLAALAAGNAGADYLNQPGIAGKVEAMRAYLIRERDSQVLINRMMLLWASSKIPRLLTSAQRDALVEEALGKQRADGGFSLSAFVGDWKRHDSTPLETGSDGLTTAIVVIALEKAGVPREHAAVRKALAWLNANQVKTEGRWLAYSLNKQRDLSTDAGKFMSDAATAYAVLALE